MTVRQTQHWAVTVERNGEQIVCIELNCLSGREISDEDERIIRIAAEHLLAFVGTLESRLATRGVRDMICDDICDDCPPPEYPTDETRCAKCPRSRFFPGIAKRGPHDAPSG